VIRKNKRIVIVDDYEESGLLLSRILGSSYECHFVSDGAKAFPVIFDLRPDLVLLDYVMPNVTGLEVCKMIRAHEGTKNIPVIFISGASTVNEKILAFEQGANDFVSKPFHIQELILRIKARLADRSPLADNILAVANLQMKLLSRQVFVEGEEVHLTPRQFEILKILLNHKNNLVTRETCLSKIWNGCEVTSRNVDAQINYLKRKINKFSGKIVAVPSYGYRLEVHE